MTTTRARLLVLPDKFRGSMSATAFCEATRAAALASGWSPEALEMSDGGEGFARAMAPEGEVREATVTGPLGRELPAEWRLTEIAGRRVAVVEAAAACGLELAGGPAHNHPLAATTRGVGELIRAGLAAGVKEVVVGCGGSASTDGGRGALEALDAFPPSAGAALGEVDLLVAYDVSIPFRDAATRFAPQKGASGAQVLALTQRLDELAALYRASGRDISLLAGSGSAGGLAGGLAAIGGRLQAGFGVVAESIGLEDRMSRCDAVVTGEGSFDKGSFEGKVVGGVLAACTRAPHGPPVLCIVGSATEEATRVARGSGATVVVLSEQFGPKRSFTDAPALVRRVVEEWLASPDRRGPRQAGVTPTPSDERSAHQQG
ncbi:MAG: glycerate kinase [Acidimicrobiales bacterium]